MADGNRTGEEEKNTCFDTKQTSTVKPGKSIAHKSDSIQCVHAIECFVTTINILQNILH